MKNIFKKIAAMSAAVMMMVSVASMGASAAKRDYWEYRHIPAAPANIQKFKTSMSIPFYSGNQKVSCTRISTSGTYITTNVKLKDTKKFKLNKTIQFTRVSHMGFIVQATNNDKKKGNIANGKVGYKVIVDAPNSTSTFSYGNISF